MRKLTILTLLLLSSINFVYTQSGWLLQTSQFHMSVSKIYFINELTGWVSIAGGYTFTSSGSFAKTVDGGISWQVLHPPGCTAHYDFNFINDMTGWLVGTCSFDTYPYNIGYLSKTTNSGLSFINQRVDTGSGFSSVFFIDINTGWAAGGWIQSPYGIGVVYKTTNAGEPIGIEPISLEIPSSFSLFQNYPNPFNPTTNIKFDISKLSSVRLIVYDMLGKEVSTLVNEQLKQGTYEADWYASNYPSGVYFYKLTADEYIEAKKMILIK